MKIYTICLVLFNLTRRYLFRLLLKVVISQIVSIMQKLNGMAKEELIDLAIKQRSVIIHNDALDSEADILLEDMKVRTKAGIAELKNTKKGFFGAVKRFFIRFRIYADLLEINVRYIEMIQQIGERKVRESDFLDD